PPVVRVAREPDVLIGLELDEFERTGADRMAAHVARADVAGIDRRPAGGQQHQQTGMRPLQMEGDLVITVDRDLLQIAVPGLARIDAKFLDRLAGEHVPGAFDVLGGERLAVVPSHTLMQWKGQLRAILVPYPAGCELRNDSLRAVQLYVLVEQDEIVEDPH